MDSIIDALTDTAQMVPLLAVIYVLIGFLEYRYGNRLGAFVSRIGIWGPVGGAVFGCLPQCGVSVVSSAFYVKRLVSMGTLLAVYISTSDEAIPVLLSNPKQAHIVGLLISIKVAIAFIAGSGIDLLMHKSRDGKKQTDGLALNYCCQETIKKDHGCCDHEITSRPSALKALVVHPLWHTLKIVLFLFILTVILNLIVQTVGTDRFSALFMKGTIFQPVLAAFVGLIPNCFASVFLVQLFAKGIISFGALLSGLCAAAGLGILVLIKENKDFKNSLLIIALLVSVSIFVGIIIQLEVR